MKIGIMQAYFFPYLGYFQLIHAVDEFVLYGHVDFTRQSWITKNRLLQKGTEKIWDITMPVEKKSKGRLIIQKEIKTGLDWRKPIIDFLQFNYKKAIYFEEIFPFLHEVILTPETLVHNYNVKTIIAICKFIGIQTPIDYQFDWATSFESELLAKDLSPDERKHARVIGLCNKFKSNHYLNPVGGSELYDKATLKDHDIALNFIQTTEHTYQQFDRHFSPYLSIIDVLMHNGRENTKKLIENNYKLV